MGCIYQHQHLLFLCCVGRLPSSLQHTSQSEHSCVVVLLKSHASGREMTNYQALWERKLLLCLQATKGPLKRPSPTHLKPCHKTCQFAFLKICSMRDYAVASPHRSFPPLTFYLFFTPLLNTSVESEGAQRGNFKKAVHLAAQQAI